MRRFNSSSLISAVVAAFLLVTGAFAQAETSISNFGKISDGYYRGGQPQGSDYTALAAMGVRTVINLTSHDAEETEKSMVENAGMKYVQIPMTTHEYPSLSKVNDFLQLVNDPANQPVFVHCVGGKHRTGVMTAAYRMKYDGWSADQAYEEMKEYKFGASFLHPQLKRFVFDYQKQLSNTAPLTVTAAQ